MPNLVKGPSHTADSSKAMNLRLSREQARELEVIAQVEGVAVAEVVRRAIHSYVEGCTSDAEFRRRSREALAEHVAILERFAGD